jgi:hypothetical protein
MKKKSKKQAIVKVETKLKKVEVKKGIAKAPRQRQVDMNLKEAKYYRDYALDNLKAAVKLYCAAEAELAGAYLEAISAGHALRPLIGKR